MEIKSENQPIKVEVVSKWYKTWWGILAIWLFYPILLPLVIWKYTSWNKLWKITATALILLVFIFFASFIMS